MIWETIKGNTLAQGDLLPGVLIPVIRPDFPTGSDTQLIDVDEYDLITATQSCDLEQGKVSHVVAVHIMPISEFQKTNPTYENRKRWNEVRKGRVEQLHLLASPEYPYDNGRCLVVDFRSVHSLPLAYVQNHAASFAERYRLRPPYLEHFSQAFGRFFMRVALPRPIPDFK